MKKWFIEARNQNIDSKNNNEQNHNKNKHNNKEKDLMSPISPQNREKQITYVKINILLPLIVYENVKNNDILSLLFLLKKTESKFVSKNKNNLSIIV